MRCRLRSKKGFTLVELLAALLILTLMLSVVSAGISMAFTIYRKSLFISESETLSATVDTALSDVLRFAENVATDKDGQVSMLTNDYYGISYSMIGIDSDGYIVYNTDLLLIGTGAYTSLRIKDFSLQYDNTAHVFSGSYTIYNRKDTSMSKDFSFTFRSVAG